MTDKLARIKALIQKIDKVTTASPAAETPHAQPPDEKSLGDVADFFADGSARTLSQSEDLADK